MAMLRDEWSDARNAGGAGGGADGRVG
jgi:hypothetical protein